MKTLAHLLAISIALAIAPLTSSDAQDPNFKPPGTDERAAVDRANAELDKVYKALMGKLDAEQQKSLKEAQRAWIKWRDAEAELIARVGGDVGGSALRVDFLIEQEKLIKQRLEVLKGFIKEAEKNH